jgi:hypothetical protein
LRVLFAPDEVDMPEVGVSDSRVIDTVELAELVSDVDIDDTAAAVSLDLDNDEDVDDAVEAGIVDGRLVTIDTESLEKT